MSSTEGIILRDVLYSKMPGSTRRKCVPLFVELTPTQLHIFEAVTVAASGSSASLDLSITGATAPSGAGRTRHEFYIQGKQIRSLWRDQKEDVRKIEGPGRRSRLYKFYMQRAGDGLYKFKLADEERRNRWVEELMTSYREGSTQPDTAAHSESKDVHFVNYTTTSAIECPPLSPPPPSSSSLPPPASSSLPINVRQWREPTKTEDGRGSRHLSLRRQPSNDSDFPRSRSSSMFSMSSHGESGYSSIELGTSKSPSRSTSREDMPDWEDSQPPSPKALSPEEETTKTFFQQAPKVTIVSQVDAEMPEIEDDKLLLSDLRNFMPDVNKLSGSTTSLKGLSPVPEESETDICKESGEVVYLLKDPLEYRVDKEGKVISLIEEIGIAIDVPSGAISDRHHDDEVTVKINVCLRGPFDLPEGYELVSPVFHVEPGVDFAEKPVEVSIVHFLNIKEDNESCYELKFVSAPAPCDISKETTPRGCFKFRHLDGGTFLPGRRIGRIALQHFCLIGVAVKHKMSAADAAKSEDILATPRIRDRSPVFGKQRSYIALLYSPLSLPDQPPCRYHIVFSISLSHPVYVKNLEKQLSERFPADAKLWRTSSQIDYASDVIELEIPHEDLQKLGYKVHTDLGCSISKTNVDTVRRSSFSRSEYANYIDYPPRILMRVQQTALSQSPNDGAYLCPKLTLKGTLHEKCFNIPLPASDSSPSPHPNSTPPLPASDSSPSPHPHSTPPLRTSDTAPSPHPHSTPPQFGSSLPSYVLSSSTAADRRSLVTLQKKERALHGTPDMKELGEKVTPRVHPKWYHIGVQLGLETATLNGIELCHPTDVKRRLNDVFNEWMCRCEVNATWMTLIEILRSESIGERQLANELEKSFD